MDKQEQEPAELTQWHVDRAIDLACLHAETLKPSELRQSWERLGRLLDKMERSNAA